MTLALIAACLGGLLRLDGRVIGRTMLGEPLYAAVITGACVGHVPEGIIIGCFLQLLWLNLLPEGAVVPPDGTPPAVVATVLAAGLGSRVMVDPYALAVFLIALVVPLGLASRWIDMRLLEWHGRLGDWVDVYAHHGHPGAIGRVLWLSAAGTFFAGAVLCFLPVFVGMEVLPKVLATLPPQVMKGMEVAYLFVLPLGLAVAFELFLVEGHALRFFVGSFALASLAFLWLGWDRPWIFLAVVGVGVSLVLVKHRFT